MFEVGFSEILLISVIALVVLGPEKLPRLAAQVGRWMGKARSMARQFREQLEEEVQVAETQKTRPPEVQPVHSHDRRSRRERRGRIDHRRVRAAADVFGSDRIHAAS